MNKKLLIGLIVAVSCGGDKVAHLGPTINEQDGGPDTHFSESECPDGQHTEALDDELVVCVADPAPDAGVVVPDAGHPKHKKSCNECPHHPSNFNAHCYGHDCRCGPRSKHEWKNNYRYGHHDCRSEECDNRDDD